MLTFSQNHFLIFHDLTFRLNLSSIKELLLRSFSEFARHLGRTKNVSDRHRQDRTDMATCRHRLLGCRHIQAPTQVWDPVVPIGADRRIPSQNSPGPTVLKLVSFKGCRCLYAPVPHMSVPNGVGAHQIRWKIARFSRLQELFSLDVKHYNFLVYKYSKNLVISGFKFIYKDTANTWK